MSIDTRTWPYGTTRRGIVVTKLEPPNMTPAQLIKDDQGEGHICVGDACADFSAGEGDTGTLTFTEGGPTGGYWRFRKDPK